MRLNCYSSIAQAFVDRYWAESWSVAELADNIVEFLHAETTWKHHVCTHCGHFDRTDPNYCPVCGARAVR